MQSPGALCVMDVMSPTLTKIIMSFDSEHNICPEWCNHCLGVSPLFDGWAVKTAQCQFLLTNLY